MRASFLLAGALVALAAQAPAARAGSIGERYLAEGNDFFRRGNYFLASESFRCAVLDDPTDGWRKIQLASSLFALGHYAYASVSIRRGVKALGFPDDLEVEIAPLFPSAAAFDRSLSQARRYLQYYPTDPHALTVVAWVSYFAGDRDEAERMCRRLLALDGRDPFAAYVVRRIEMQRGGGRPPATIAPSPAPPRPKVAPPALAASPAVPPAAEPTKPKEAPAEVARPEKVEPRPGERVGPASSLSRPGEPRPALAK
jgi:tetratricopeptide (TPR) repeat protein